MLKILILCKNNSTAKSILNKVISNIKELQLIGIANNENESLELIQKREPNLIISTNEKIINLIKTNYTTYTPGIILISKSKENNKDWYYRNLLILNYNLNFKKISNCILDFIQNNITYSKKQTLIELLSKIGFDLKLVGTTYLIDSILYVNTYKGAFSFEQLQRDIYSHVATINHTNIDRVKWSIARSINYMYNKQTQNTYRYAEKYFGLEYPQKPTPKLVINSIANILDM